MLLRQPRDHPRPREANKHTFIMSAAQSAATNALLAIGAMLIVPQFTLVHPYLHLLIVAPLLVFAGCQRAALEAAKGTASQMETVSKKDAMQFPLIGSAVLFGLYVVIKFVKKEYLDMLLNVYFALLGSLSIHACVCPPLTKALGMEGLHQMHISLHWKRWKARDAEDADPIEVSFSWFDVGLYLPCAAASVAYAVTKLWWLNNLLGCAFSVQGIEMLGLGSYAIGCILLAGLFVYDVFWVFGTDVMVSVAKGLNAPVKILFPKALGVKPIPCSMLGLGDIVIPGIFVALMMRFDLQRGLASQPYFYANLVAYELGLCATVGVMHFFNHAQPALLYLVPACIGASLLTAAARGELKALLNFSVEKKKEETKSD
jgi:minor histocompatibility antigen H13